MKSLLFGLAAGVAIGYFLATDDREALIEDAKDLFKGKDLVKDTVQKGKAKMAAAKSEVEDEVHGMSETIAAMDKAETQSEPPTRKEKERVMQASRIVTRVSKVLKPILSMVAAHLLNTRKRKHYEQHS